MTLVDLIMTVFLVVLWGGFGLGLLATLFGCGEEPAQEQVDAERTAELVLRILAARQAPVEVELMRSVALAPVVVAKLGYFQYSAEGRSGMENLECAICLGEIEHGEECSEVPACQHLFHRDCIGVWMKTSTSCPLCRCGIVAGSSEPVLAADEMV